MTFEDYWKNIHKGFINNELKYDCWLDNYKEFLNRCQTKVLDLGCGMGNNTLYLLERGFDVVALDYSQVALSSIKNKFKNVETMLFDISTPLPFHNCSFDLIIADLSLHYFDTNITKAIIKEIKRILTPKGVLLARVNSVLDVNHGASQGELLEDNYYFVKGCNKRFFTLETAREFFSIIGEVSLKEADMLRYAQPKKVIEIKVEKK